MLSHRAACASALLVAFLLPLPEKTLNANATRTSTRDSYLTTAPQAPVTHLDLGAQRAAAATKPRWAKISPPLVSTDPNKPPMNYGFLALAIDPVHTKTLYVGTCYQGLWKTKDGGHTWFKVNIGANGAQLDTGRLWSIAIDRFHPQTLYVANGYGAEQGVWKSTDGGVDWQQMLPATSAVALQTSSDVLEIATDPYRGGHILVAFHSIWGTYPHPKTAGILESKDGGNTWLIHQPQRNWTGVGEVSHYVSFLSSSSTWLFERVGGFWRTADSGKTWVRVAPNEGGGGIYRATNGVWYAGALQTVLRSTDDGRSWNAVGPGGTLYLAVVGDGKNLYIQPSQSFDVTPQTHYYYSPESSGTKWAQYSDQTFSNGPMSMVYDPINRVVYSANWRAGVWKLRSPASPLPLPAK